VRSYGSRVSWVIVGATIISWSFLLFGYDDSYPWLALVEVIAGLAGLEVVVVALLDREGAFPPSLGITALAVTLFLFFVWCWVQIRVAPAYGTDEAAFDQYAAQLLIHGRNPYTASMAPSFSLFHVSPDGYTFRLNGSPVTQLSYPALSFLFYVPLLLLGMTSQAAIFMNVVAWAATIALAYRLLPRDVKPLALVLGSFAIYTGFAVGGVTDALYVPFLLLAVYQWDRFTDLRGWHRWVSPAAMGLSLGIKQTPWFILPFLVIGIFFEARDRAEPTQKPVVEVWRYLWRVAVVFLIPNLYFIARSPSAWVRGVLTPVIDHLVPAGQGWVAISDFLGQGGGFLRTYSILFASVALTSVVLFAMTYPRPKAIMVFFPSLILFFSERSFSNYLVMMLLPAIVAACSTRISPQHAPLRLQLWGTRFRRAVVVTTLSLVPLSLVLVSVAEQPIGLRVESVTTTGQLATVVKVAVTVTNRTGRPLTPVFTSQAGGAITATWIVINGPHILPAHAVENYTLQAPNFFAQPALSGGFQVVALTQSPAAMSVSKPFTPTYWHVNLNPEAFNTPVSVNHTVHLTAQVVGPTDNPVDIAGIPVFLGQISYTQQGLLFTQAIINNGSEGETPIEALTDSDGIAAFSVKVPTSSPFPIYFEANLVNGQYAYPYGYSDIVPILFH
jgi:uncharacterized membrane protein